MVCERPHVGVGVIIEKNDTVLLMKRKGSIGENTWSFPGGKLEKFESIEDCAIREAKEETNLNIFNISIDKCTNDIFLNDNVHYVTVFVRCKFTGQAQIMENNKCSDMGWFNKNKLPKDLFPPLKEYISKYNL